MKKLCKLFSLVVCLAIIVASFGTFVSAEEIGDTHKNGDLNDSAVRALVVRYFREREAYLNGESDGIPSAIDPLVRDEEKHRLSLQEAEVAFMTSAITVDEVSCWDDVAEVKVTETATYNVGMKGTCETIIHKIYVYGKSIDSASINSDRYRELTSDFNSCSYVPEELENSVRPQSMPGSKYCVTYIASREVGYTEQGENITKYGAWIGMDGKEWCASFVSWCAAQANVSSSVIVYASGCYTMMDHFVRQDRYYNSIAEKGSYTPKVGDVFFQYGSASAPGHVGFVVALEGNYIWVIDGNCGDKVSQHIIALDDSSLKAFGNPAYSASDHNLRTSGGQQVCTVCGYVAGITI